LIGLFGYLEKFICETLESVAILGFVIFMRVENADLIQEMFKLS
jgi:hypothetical protein